MKWLCDFANAPTQPHFGPRAWTVVACHPCRQPRVAGCVAAHSKKGVLREGRVNSSTLPLRTAAKHIPPASNAAERPPSASYCMAAGKWHNNKHPCFLHAVLIWPCDIHRCIPLSGDMLSHTALLHLDGRVTSSKSSNQCCCNVSSFHCAVYILDVCHLNMSTCGSIDHSSFRCVPGCC